MKHWQETAAVVGRLSELIDGGARAALATVVRISGSAYRRPGAKLLVEESGQTYGGISGGCLETDVRSQALEVIAAGASRLLHYDTGSDEETLWGMGLGCEGAVDIYVERADARWPALAQLREALAAGSPFAVATSVAGPLAGNRSVITQGALRGSCGSPELDRELTRLAMPLLEEDGARSRLAQIGQDQIFIDVLSPPPRLIVFGAGDDARPLAAMASQAGFDVTVVDHRPAFLTAERFPPPANLLLRRASEGLESLTLGRRHYAVVQTHALAHDRAWVRALAAQPIAYLGLLGPKGRKEQVLRDVPAAGDKLYAPVGLDLGADGPEQVAISIVAEMLAVHARREPAHLRSRAGGIHEP